MGFGTLVGNAMRHIFKAITLLIFSLVSVIYNLLYEIANTGAIDSVVESLGKNIYYIIGVIMLFKLAFSIITYIINPDQFSDKSNGFGSLVKNVFIVVALILVVPIIFNKAMDLQRIILEEDILGRVITGVSKSGGNTLDAKVGKKMSFNLLSGFVRPNEAVFGENVCSSVLSRPSEYQSVSSYLELPDLPDGDPLKDSVNAYKTCLNTIKEKAGSDTANAYDLAMQQNSVSKLLNSNIISATSGDEFVFDFNYIAAPLVGGFTGYILLMFCIDIAVRSVKLIFLRLIAPLPIVSYVDPKGQKGMFSTWVKTSVSTYLDLFVRLAAVYFSIYIIENVILARGQLITYSAKGDPKSPGIFVTIFMILGALTFAKELPKLLEDITGLKLAGDFSLNPMKKMAAIPLAGGALAAGMAVGGAGVLAAGRYAAGSAKAGVMKLMGKDASEISGQKAKTKALFDARMKAGINAASENLKTNPLGGSGKYVTSGAGYKAMTTGKDATFNAMGESIWNKYHNQVDDKAVPYEKKFEGIISNAEMRKTAGDLLAAKDRRNSLQSTYEIMQMEYNAGVKDKNGNAKWTAEDVDNARVNYTKASSDYDKINAAFTTQKANNKKDAERYDAYMKYDDFYRATERAQEAVVPPQPFSSSSSTSSTSSSQPTQQSSVNSSSGSTEIQERINIAANVHDAPTREEHQQQASEYADFWYSPSASNYLDAQEKEQDKMYGGMYSNGPIVSPNAPGPAQTTQKTQPGGPTNPNGNQSQSTPFDPNHMDG